MLSAWVRTSSSVLPRAWQQGPSSTSCCRLRCWCSASLCIAPRGLRGRAFGMAALGAVAGGGYWYLRNLAHSGNPLPWIHHLGPIDLPAPEQALGGREAHSVLGYLTDGTVWSDWLLPGLHGGLWFLWPLLLLASLAGLLLATVQSRGSFVGFRGDKGTTRSCAGPGGARRPRGGAGVARRPDLGLGPRGDAARLRVRPPLPRPSSHPWPRAAPHRSPRTPQGAVELWRG